MAENEQQSAALEAVVDEFSSRLRRGENPDIQEYLAKYPDLAWDLAELLTAAQVLEGVKDRAGTSGSALPERLGEFRVEREIGRGGMGMVLMAEQESLGRKAAVKVLPRLARPDAASRERFQREARTAAQLNHPHIVPVFGAGEEDGCPWYAMQYIEGAGLDRVLADLASRGPVAPGTPADQVFAALVKRVEQGRDAPDEAQDQTFLEQTVYPGLGENYYRAAAQLVADAAQALAHAHGAGVLHRDVKPANLLLDRAGRAYVADFGLAKAMASADGTLTAGILGTPRYLAPEQYSGRADARSDIYGLGLILHELLTLRPAFAVSDPHALMKRILEGDMEPAARRNPHAPAALSAIAAKAAAKDPAERYQSAQAMAEDLARHLQGATPLAQAQQARRNARRTLLLALAFVLALALAVGLATVLKIFRVQDSLDLTPGQETQVAPDAGVAPDQQPERPQPGQGLGPGAGGNAVPGPRHGQGGNGPGPGGGQGLGPGGGQGLGPGGGQGQGPGGGQGQGAGGNSGT